MKGPPVHLVAAGVHLLLHEPEEDHRRVRPEQDDQGDELADPNEHRNEHDHQRRADRVLPPARRVDRARDVRLVPAARPAAAQREVVDRGEQQERRGNWAAGNVSPIAAAPHRTSRDPFLRDPLKREETPISPG
jgi:hypothetical protein